MFLSLPVKRLSQLESCRHGLESVNRDLVGWIGNSGDVPVSGKICRLVASTVCRSLGNYKLSCSLAIEIPLLNFFKTSLLSIVPRKGKLSLSNLLILLPLILSTLPHSHRFLGSPLSVLMQTYPAGTSSGSETIGKLWAGLAAVISPKTKA